MAMIYVWRECHFFMWNSRFNFERQKGCAVFHILFKYRSVAFSLPLSCILQSTLMINSWRANGFRQNFIHFYSSRCLERQRRGFTVLPSVRFMHRINIFGSDYVNSNLIKISSVVNVLEEGIIRLGTYYRSDHKLEKNRLTSPIGKIRSWAPVS